MEDADSGQPKAKKIKTEKGNENGGGTRKIQVQWNPDFSNLLGKRKLVRITEGFENSGVKLQCLTGEGKSVLVRIIGSFEKPRVREIGILLYLQFLHLWGRKTDFSG